MNYPFFLTIIILTVFLFSFVLLQTVSHFSKRGNKNLVFTSAGNNTEFYKYWLGSNRNYDVWVVYYENDDKIFNKYKSIVDKIWKMKGSKFQNFYKIFNNHYQDLMNYDRFFIVDDDIIISTDDINNLFEMSKKYKLSICQPAFIKEHSKISHKITEVEPNVILKYTNFVEVNTPVFDKKSLLNLMKYYHPSLIGWGIDYLYIWANGFHKTNKYAIIDSIKCINPQDIKKNNKRELNKIKNFDKRTDYWKKFADHLKIPDKWELVVYKKVYKF